MRIEVKRKVLNVTQKWIFGAPLSSEPATLYLDEYTLAVVSPSQRNPRVIDKYDRILTRDNTLKTERVPLPDDVMEDARKQFIKMITIKKWDRD